MTALPAPQATEALAVPAAGTGTATVTPLPAGAAIKVLGAAAVGPRERVVLVEIGEQVLVLGVAPGSVTRLHDMKRSELPLPADTAGIAAPAGKAFAAWLKQATERRNAG